MGHGDITERRAEGAQASDTALLIACARLLFANGQTTERTIQSVEHLGAHLGLTVAISARWGELALRIAGPDGTERLEVVEVAPAGVEMHKVTETLDVMNAVCAGSRTPAQALADLAGVAKLPPVSLARFAGLAGAGAAALGVIFGTSQPLSLLLIFASAAGGAALRRGLAHLFPSFLPQPLGAAVLAGLVAAFAARVLPGTDIFLIALCPCMVLVPGPHLLNSAIDLARLRLPLGGARLAFASLVILLISVGLIAGMSAGGANLPVTGGGSAPLLADVIAAGIAVSAYGTFFSMPWRMLPFPMLVGMGAHALHWAVLKLGGGLGLSAFLACLFVGAVVTPVANRLRLPFAAVAFASVVSLIPGSFVFRMAADLVGMLDAGREASLTLLLAALSDGTNAATIMVAMAFGLILPKMLLDHLSPPKLP